jgi:hypothetical protein
MLAVRRTSVSEVAQSLAEDGCLTYTRGLITITDRPRLQANAGDWLRSDPPGHRCGVRGSLARPASLRCA